MMRWACIGIGIAALVLAACKEKLTPAQQAAADDKAITQVEAAQHNYAPPQPLDPEPITPADLTKAGLLDAGCSFEPEGQTDPVLVARAKRAVMKMGARLTSFASDPGSKDLPLGTWSHYVGKAGSLRIATAGGDGDLQGQSQLEWFAELTVTDEHDRIVYTSRGRLRCGV
jgi:hypothetical protein